jgi:tight adherence protein C
MLLLIALLTFLSVALLTLELSRPRSPVVRRRLGIEDRAHDAPRSRTDGTLVQRVVSPTLSSLGRRVAAVLPANVLRNLSRLLVAANEPWSLPGFLAVWVLSTGAGALLWAYIALSSPSITSLQLAVVGMAIMSLAILLPYARVRSKAKARQRAIIRALPDALDLLVTTVEAGMGVDASFAMVADKTQGPLSDSFAHYLRLVGLGRPRREALTEVAERTGVDDLIAIANSVSQGEALGTPVGDVLRAQATDLRARRRERAQARAQRAPVLMTIPIALCFLPAMAAVVVVPSILNLLNFVRDLGSVSG